jgi:hypothetical protein
MRIHGMLILVLVTLAGCVQMPLGPTVMVMPGPGKPFDRFVHEETFCRNYAAQQTGLTPGEATQQGVATGAIAGTALGAAAGAAIGAATGHPGMGAAVGAGTGLLAGTATGASAGQSASWTLQWRYNVAYQQCMYAYGNQVPGFPIISAPPPPPPPPAAPPPR